MSNKIDCDNSDIVKLVNKVLEKLKSENSPDINKVQDALKVYLEDCTICTKEGQNDYVCHNIALEKLMRQMPIIRDSVYPWKNYDWNYGNFIDNNYSAKATGSSPDGSKYINNLKIFFKFMSAYLLDPNPNNNSVAGGTDSNSDYPKYGCEGNNEIFCKARNKVINKNPQDIPYDDAFLKKHSLNGVESSSYYIKVGTCPQNKYKNKDNCIKNGFDWVSDSCYSNRYAFINNTPGLKLTNIFKPDSTVTVGKGYIPSLVNNMASLSSDKIFKSMLGKDVPGFLEIQPCKETFLTMNDPDDSFLIVLSSIIFLVGCGTLLAFNLNK